MDESFNPMETIMKDNLKTDRPMEKGFIGKVTYFMKAISRTIYNMESVFSIVIITNSMASILKDKK